MHARTRIQHRTFLLLVSTVSPACGEKQATILSPTEVVASRVKGELPRDDPGNSAWNSAPEHVATLLLQDQAPPKLDRVSVGTLRVRALHDGSWLAFRLEWSDPTNDDLVGPARFGDMVAVQLPTEAGANVPDAAMGQIGRPVRVHLWRAASQRLLGAKEDAIALLYPNAVSDHYPPLEAPARTAANSMTVRRPDSPTEDLIAEGFGTLSPAAEQISRGRGIHDGKSWRVVIARPLDESGAIVAGARSYVALAVWDGAAKNVGSRKMRSGWIPLEVKR